MAYDIGDVVRASVTFQVANEDTDPTVVRFKFKDPAAIATTYVYGSSAQLVRDAAGKYHVDIDITLAGTYLYRWEGTGAAQGAEEDAFVVNASRF